MSGAPLSGADLQRLAEFLYRRTGMQCGESKRYYIDRRVAERIAVTSTKDFADYFSLLRGNAIELEVFINAFTVNETYFYREEHQLRCLSKALLPAVTAGQSAGRSRQDLGRCRASTGEETISLAIWLLENWRMVDAYNVEIIGSDIDTRTLAEARLGLYGERALFPACRPMCGNIIRAAGRRCLAHHPGSAGIGELHAGQS